MATAKHNFQRLILSPAKPKLIASLDELQKLAKDAFGVAAKEIIEKFIYAKMPPHLRKSINQAHLQNGTYEQILSHLEREFELNGLETPDEQRRKHFHETSYTTKLRRAQTNLSSLQKTRSLEKSVPSTQTRERPSPNCHEW